MDCRALTALVVGLLACCATGQAATVSRAGRKVLQSDAGITLDTTVRRLLAGPDLTPDTPTQPADPTIPDGTFFDRMGKWSTSGGSNSGSGTAAADTAGSGASSADGSDNTGARRLLAGPDLTPDTPTKPSDPSIPDGTFFDRMGKWTSSGSSSTNSGSGTAAADTAGSGASSADGSDNTGARRLLAGPDLTPDTPTKPSDPTTAATGLTAYDRAMAYAAKVEQERGQASSGSSGSTDSSGK